MRLQMFAEDKREAPTQRRRRQARQKGQVFRSNELSTAFCILVVYLTLRISGPHMVQSMHGLARHYWGQVASIDVVGETQTIYMHTLLQVGLFMWPLGIAVVLSGLTIGLAQVGFAFNISVIAPKFDKLNPVAGAQKLFSRRTLAEGVKAILKVALVSLIVWFTMRGRIDLWPRLASYHPLNAVKLVMEAVNAILLAAGLSLLALGMADYGYQWWEHEQSLRMTRQELKDEMKDVEGRPEVKSALRSRQRELTRNRMMAAVSEADVVVTNPIHFAVALKYDAERPAPEVIAKGQEHMARRIIEEATKNEITVVSRPELARALYRSVEVGAFIPAELYQAVAEVLAFVYRARDGEGGTLP